MRPRLTIDVTAIEHNSRLVKRLLEPYGIRLVGVTKACLGDPEVAGAMLRGGAAALADSRPDNISRLRASFPDKELQLLRPAPVDSADLFFISSADQARILLGQSGSRGLRFLLMVETGDGREGVPLTSVASEGRRIAALAGARLVGAGTNIACARPKAPLSAALAGLDRAAEILLSQLSPGLHADSFRISAGGSGLLRLFTAGGGPFHENGSGMEPSLAAGMDELRCGEAILLGSVPGAAPAGSDRPYFLDGARIDAFMLEATVLEVYEKAGTTQALLDVGSQDIGAADPGALTPLRQGARVLSATSDYLSLAIESADGGRGAPAVGETISIIPGYYALVAAMTSPYVEKTCFRGNKGHRLFTGP